MADVKQDLLSLQYSQNFEIQGMQEANIDLQLPPCFGHLRHPLRRGDRRRPSRGRRHRQAL